MVADHTGRGDQSRMNLAGDRATSGDRTARPRLGLTVPLPLLGRAAQVIE